VPVAEIVQRLSGKTIRGVVREEVIDPLGLKSTGLGSATGVTAGCSRRR
jgi:CubicO group peptidase (beta-lactamase class C family)